jgi:hypothetical protein
MAVPDYFRTDDHPFVTRFSLLRNNRLVPGEEAATGWGFAEGSHASDLAIIGCIQS